MLYESLFALAAKPKTRKALSLSLIALALSGSAYASKNFCGDIPDCRKVNISNEAAVLVTSVTVTQQPTNGACTKDKRNFSQNLRSANESLNADAFNVFLNPNCKYRVRYSTTSGCLGRKKGEITVRNFEDGASHVALKRSCGRLKVKVW